jgi:hypothetical protein
VSIHLQLIDVQMEYENMIEHTYFEYFIKLHGRLLSILKGTSHWIDFFNSVHLSVLLNSADVFKIVKLAFFCATIFQWKL